MSEVTIDELLERVDREWPTTEDEIDQWLDECEAGDE
jgi:hypothetical protein